jgi:hypothetical protein
MIPCREKFSSNPIYFECLDVFVVEKHSFASNCVTTAYASMGCENSKDESMEEEELSKSKVRRKRRPERIPTGYPRRRRSPAVSLIPTDELVYTTRAPTVISFNDTEPSVVLVKKTPHVPVQVNPWC